MPWHIPRFKLPLFAVWSHFYRATSKITEIPQIGCLQGLGIISVPKNINNLIREKSSEPTRKTSYVNFADIRSVPRGADPFPFASHLQSHCLPFVTSHPVSPVLFILEMNFNWRLNPRFFPLASEIRHARLRCAYLITRVPWAWPVWPTQG